MQVGCNQQLQHSSLVPASIPGFLIVGELYSETALRKTGGEETVCPRTIAAPSAAETTRKGHPR